MTKRSSQNTLQKKKKVIFLTCKEGHKHGYPAQYVGPGEAPVAKASSQEVDCHSSVDGHTQ